MRVWLDIDNPPQVQYLLPFRRAFEAAGAEVVVTARDYGDTVAMLEREGASFEVFGEQVGRGKARKVAALLRRAAAFRRHFAATGAPDALLCASRPSAVAARWMGTPSYVIGDYEYANVIPYRFTGSVILHPRAIDAEVFRRRGMPLARLIAFDGIKEDITFADVDLDAVEPHDFGPRPDDAPRVLFRPPSETSHYYDETSSTVARAALERLAGQGVQVVFSPRDPRQAEGLRGLPWRHEPIVLDGPIPFVPLLKSVDAVVCSGGTMLREAAYIGIPAYSIFQSEIGGVDRWLAAQGRATLIESQADLEQLNPSRRPPLGRLDSNPGLIDELAGLVLQGARRPVAA